MTPKIDRNWKLTDGDTKQFGRQLTNTLFEFKQKGVKAKLIDLTEYEQKEIEHIVNAYGYTFLTKEDKNPALSNIHEQYGKEADWITAECIFESEIV